MYGDLHMYSIIIISFFRILSLYQPSTKDDRNPPWLAASTSGKPPYKVIFDFFHKYCIPQSCYNACNQAGYTDTERGHFLTLGH